MREIRTSGSMSGVRKRSTAGPLRHRQTKEPANGYALPTPPRRTSTLLVKTTFSAGGTGQGTDSPAEVGSIASSERLSSPGGSAGPSTATRCMRGPMPQKISYGIVSAHRASW